MIERGPPHRFNGPDRVEPSRAIDAVHACYLAKR
jgi:hypothetical protein